MNQNESLMTMILQSAVNNIEASGEITISDIISYVSTRPFNMKGQEFEELIAYMLNKEFKKLNAKAEISTPQGKKSNDLVFSLENHSFPFSVKNYSIDRLQISTLATHLEMFKLDYVVPDNAETKIMSNQKKTALLSLIAYGIGDGISIFALSNKKQDSINIFLQTLNKESFLSKIVKIEQDRTGGKTTHNKLWLYHEVDENVPILSLDLGQNALNRGLWLHNAAIFDRNSHFFPVKNDLFVDLVSIENANLKIWRELSDAARIENFFAFLSEHKKSYYQ